MECIFCKIVRGEIPSNKVYESQDVVAFLDINPCSPGHTLLIPKKHYTSMMDMSDSDISEIFKQAKKLAPAIRASVQAQGFNIGVNDGLVAGQEVQHMHIHIIPRFSGDNGRSIQSVVRAGSKEPIASIANKIKDELKPKPDKEWDSKFY